MQKHALDYGTRRRVRHRKLIVVLLVVSCIASACYWQQDRLGSYWYEGRLSLLQWRCLRNTFGANTIVYEERTKETQALLKNPDYVQLTAGGVGRRLALWESLKQSMMSYQFDSPGVVYFLHERVTPSGRRVLVMADHCPSEQNPWGISTIYVMEVGGSPSKSMKEFNAHDDGFLYWFWNPKHDGWRPVNYGPYKHHELTLFAGQADPADQSKFWFDFEFDGKRGREVVQVVDPDPASADPTFELVNQTVVHLADK